MGGGTGTGTGRVRVRPADGVVVLRALSRSLTTPFRGTLYEHEITAQCLVEVRETLRPTTPSTDLVATCERAKTNRRGSDLVPSVRWSECLLQVRHDATFG